MATQVAIEDLSDWLAEQPQNTASTPYEIEITGLQVSDFDTPSQNPIRTALLANNNKYVDLGATQLPNGITSIGDLDVGGAFYECSKLCVPPIIPNSVWNMIRAFQNSGIVSPPNIPEGVITLYETFKSCQQLTTPPILPDGIKDMIYTFADSGISTPPVIPNSVVTMVGCFVHCSNLTTAPVLPESVINLDSTFEETAITTAPEIPSLVRNMNGTFYGCTELTQAPIIPSSVTVMYGCFKDCTSLEIVPNIPSSVYNLNDTFYNCSSLEEITLFEPDIENIGENCFYGCTSLTKVGLLNTTPSEADDWHIYSLHFEENSGTDYVSGTVYDRDGTTHTITSTAITKDDLTLPILTDELWFPDSAYDSDPTAIPTIIQKMIDYRYGIFKRETIPPDKKSFVLMADDPNFVVSNVLGGTAVDVVEKTNMNPVTSNAVAIALARKGLYSGAVTTTSTQYNLNGKLSDYKYLVICGLDTTVRVRGSIIIPVSFINQGFVVPCYFNGTVALSGTYVDDTHIKLQTANANQIAYCFIAGFFS